jgi:hypothetical protein
MKYFIAILFSTLLSTSTFAQNISPEEFSPIAVHFLQECTGIALTRPPAPTDNDGNPLPLKGGDELTAAEQFALATAFLNCMAFTSGVVESHIVTSQSYGVDASMWWCVDTPPISYFSLMKDVLQWVTVNEKRVVEINQSLVNASIDFRMVVLLVALREIIPCQESKSKKETK